VVTDRTEVLIPVDGVTLDDCRQRLRTWTAELRELNKEVALVPTEDSDARDDAIDAYNAKARAHYDRRNQFAKTATLCGAWILRGAQPIAATGQPR
ncbi:MAG: hypothetical protein AAGG01_12175, partial [Planctomycetota bacterium]